VYVTIYYYTTLYTVYLLI